MPPLTQKGIVPVCWNHNTIARSCLYFPCLQKPYKVEAIFSYQVSSLAEGNSCAFTVRTAETTRKLGADYYISLEGRQNKIQLRTVRVLNLDYVIILVTTNSISRSHYYCQYVVAGN